MKLFGKELKFNNKDVALKENIPTSLPANGGNADTIDNKHASDFLLSTESWIGKPKKISANIDLNTIYQSGIYSTDSDGNSATLKNRPPGSQGFIMQVFTIYGSETIAGRQIQIAYMRGSRSIYLRDKSENADWSSWVQMNQNTWRGIQDNLTSTATDQSLSANQGKILKGLIDGKAASSHTHTKENITDFPTKLSQFTNDTGFTQNALKQTISSTQPTNSKQGDVWIQLI